jgi:hypothetical protein
VVHPSKNTVTCFRRSATVFCGHANRAKRGECTTAACCLNGAADEIARRVSLVAERVYQCARTWPSPEFGVEQVHPRPCEP